MSTAVKLPFPLTIRFKSMLQSGVATRDLDVRWVSSLSWYFLNLFGLQSVFIFILGNDNGKPIHSSPIYDSLDLHPPYSQSSLLTPPSPSQPYISLHYPVSTNAPLSSRQPNGPTNVSNEPQRRGRRPLPAGRRCG